MSKTWTLAPTISDDQGNPSEYLPIDDTYSPQLHRTQQAIRHRAIHPDTPPTASPRGNHKTNAPARAPDSTHTTVHRLGPRLRRYQKSAPHALSPASDPRETPHTDLDVAGILSKRAGKISPDNAIPEFRQMIEAAGEIDTVKRAVGILGGIVEDTVRGSFGDAAYERGAGDVARDEGFVRGNGGACCF